MNRSTLAIAVLGTALGGCANLPSGEVSYRLARTDLNIKVVRTVGCDGGGNPVIASAVLPSVTHSADLTNTGGPHVLKLDWFKSSLADSDVSVELYPDSRLKAINSTTTGRGEAVVKAAISLASVAHLGLNVLNMKFEKLSRKKDRLQESSCDNIVKWGSEKVLTVTYEGPFSGRLDKSYEIKANEASAFYVRELKDVFHAVCVNMVLDPAAPEKPFVKAESENQPLVKARQPRNAFVTVSTSATEQCTDPLTPLSTFSVPFAQHGSEYDLPIPKPPLFGKFTLGASFESSGALATLRYATENGTTQALGAVEAALAASRGPTTSDKAAELQADADLIVQQQRVLTCSIAPADCK